MSNSSENYPKLLDFRGPARWQQVNERSPPRLADSQEMTNVTILKKLLSLVVTYIFPECQSQLYSVTDTSRKHNWTKDIEARKESRVDNDVTFSVKLWLPAM